MAVASLRAQIRAGAQAVQLFDSWAGSLAPDEYTRFALPATRAVLEGIADLGVPTILFGVGTGELLARMASAGPDVVGVDWRVPLAEARRRVRKGTPSRATSTPPCASPRGPLSNRRPGPSWPAPPTAAGRDTSSTSATASFPKQTRACWPPSSTWCTGRPREHDGRRPRHGARHTGEHGGDRGLLHADPARAPARARPAGRAHGGVTTPSAARRRSPRAHPGSGGRVGRRARRRAPGRYRVSFGAKHTDPLLEDAAAALAASGVEAVIGLVLTPHASSMGSGEYLERARGALGDTPLHGDHVVVRQRRPSCDSWRSGSVPPSRA